MTQTGPKGDIEDRDDCERLTRAFYERALTDPMIGYLFTDIAKLDLDAHIPVITSFWETILLGAGTYGGGAFRSHAELDAKSPLRGAHFDRWLVLWRETVDELFEGRVAEQAKGHAQRVAKAFHRRLQGLSFEEDGDVAMARAPLAVTWHGQAPAA